MKDINAIRDDLNELKPTLFAGVPRVFEKVHEGVLTALEDLNPRRRKIFDLLYKYKLYWMKLGYGHRKASPLADFLAFRKVKARLGGRIRMIISGGAPLSSELEEFLRVTSCSYVVQGYGLTETCGSTTCCYPDDMELVGTVGVPAVFCELRLEEVPELGYNPLSVPSRGEVCIRGKAVFCGYHKDSELTKEVMKGGWFHTDTIFTGDIGEMSPDGILKIIDRRKNIFKLSQGEYVAAEYLERIYVGNPYVDDIWVYGDSKQAMLVAVVVPQEVNTEKWAELEGHKGSFTDLCKLDELRDHVVQTLKVTAENNKPRLIVKANPTITVSILESLLEGCRDWKQLLQIHSQMLVSGLVTDTYAASRLLKFATVSDFVQIDYPRRLLMQQVEHSNAFLWNSLMRFYVHRGMPGDSLCLYKLMLEKGACFADNYTHPILAQACSARLSGLEGMQVHGHALKSGFDSDVYVLNTLINMYVVCARLGDARRLFDQSSVLDSVSWNSILAGYVHAGDVEGAFAIFDRMPERNSIASSSVIALLGKAGRVVDARLLFDGMTERNAVSWSAMISCYEQNDMFEDAVFAFCQMNNRDRIALDEVVMVSVLSACTHLLSIDGGVQVHGLIVRFGFESYVNLQNALIHLYSSCGDIIASQKLFQSGQNLDQISWNSMLSGYLKLGLLEEAKGLFDSMPIKDVVSWSAMIAGYAQHDRYSETLDIFQRMQVQGVEPDETTLVSLLSACTHLSALEQGKWVLTYIRKNGIKVNIILGTSIVDMFMKCGCVGSALEAFLDMPERGVSTWNALILGLAMNGQVGSCLEKFMEMLECGMTPNEITFVAVLSACRHAGLVDEGRRYFDLMIDCYNIEPNVKHYGCMVDLLGRAGLLDEAEEMIEKMPLQPDVATWGALLGACGKFGNTQMGERVGRRLIELEPLHDGFHVLLSNMYASRGRWNDVIEVRGLMANNKVAKIPGCSLIEADGVVHEFFAGDQSHPCSEQIYEMLDEIARRLEKNGYTPSINEVSLDIEDEEKESYLYRHSEKLAIAFGLISIKPPTPIRIMKNLRVCQDCHSAAKFISRAFEREIILRDRRLFHHFKDGKCSCADYW